MRYDLAIIGGGPAGYTAAERAAQGGLSTVLFEKNALGGVCLNEGCIPTKTLLYSAKLYDSIRNGAKYAVKAESPTIDMPKLMARKTKVVRKLTAGIRMKLTEAGVKLVNSEARIAQFFDNSLITIEANKEIFEAKNLLLATGSETVIPPIAGLDQNDYWTSREALDVKELPKSLIVIGGGVVGMEFAAFFNHLGVEVQVIDALNKILGPMDNELSSMLQAEYTKRGMKFHLGYQVTAVDGQTVYLRREGEEPKTLTAERLLVSVGRRAILKGFGMENLNLEMTRRGVKVDERMRTSHPHIYACGDITGCSMLAHTAVREAEVAVNQILGRDDKMNYRAIPSVVYTNPEIASVGFSEEDLVSAGILYHVKKIPMTYSGRFVAENEQMNGLCKFLFDDRKHLLGVHLLGNPASELIVTAALAIEQGLNFDTLKRIVFPHPTVSEILKEALY